MDSPNKHALRNSALRLLWQEAVNEVTSFIKPYLRDRASLPVNSVVKSGSGYRVGYRFIPDFRSILNKHSKSIETLPSVRKAVTALIDDAHLVKQIARTHRNDTTISRDDLEPIAHLHLSQIVESVLYGRDFKQLYQSYEDYLYSDSVPHVTFALLENFKSELAQIALNPSLTINQLSDKDVERYYNSADFLLNMPRSKVLRISHDIRNRYDISKGSHVDAREQVGIIEGVVTALRLVKPGSVGVNPIGCFSTSSWFGSGVTPRISPNYIDYRHGQNQPYILEDTDVPALQTTWRQLEEYPYEQWPSVHAALRRFNSSYDRTEPEDKLLEYMIGFESILLSGIGNEGDRGELRFRLALYGAYFLSEDNDERRQLSKFLKKAYDERSAVIHGRVKITSLVKVNDDKYSFADFVAQVGDKLRSTLRKILETKTIRIDDNVLFQ